MIERLFALAEGIEGARRLRMGWWFLTALYLSAVVDLGIVLLDRSEQPSKLTLALGGVLVGLTVMVAAVALALNETRLRRLRATLQPARWLIGLLLLAGLLGFGLVMRPQLLFAHIGLALAATAALILVTLTAKDAPIPHSRVWMVVGLIAVIAITALRVYSLTTYPNVDLADEPWNLSWSVTYLKTGHVSEIGMVGVPGDPTYYTTYYVPRWALLVGEWLRIVGIGLWQGRLFSVLMTFPLIAVTTLAARNLYGRASALLTALAMVASSLVVLAFRLRHDIGLALALALSIWLFSEALRRQRNWLHLLAGLVMGWGGFAHYHALVIGPLVFVALYLPRYVIAWRAGRRRPERGLWLYALGLVIGLALVGIIQVLPDVATFLANRAPRHPADVPQFLDILLGYGSALVQISWYEGLLIAFGALVALWRHRSFDLSLLILLIFGHVALAGLTNVVKDHYLVTLVPVYALLVGLFLSEVFVGQRKAVGQVALAVCLCFLLPSLGQTLKTPVRAVVSRQPIIAPPAPAAAWVLEHVAPAHSVLAENIYYTWLYDYAFQATNVIDVMTPAKLSQYPSLGDFWLSLKPDVVILDPGLSSFGNLKPLLDDAFMRQHGYTEVAQFPDGSQPVLIYARASVASL